MEIVIWLIVGLVAGGVIGALATWFISRARGGAVSAMQIKQENDKFRNEVTEHFVETGRLINQMTDSYKQVFDHLSSGAEKLVDEKSLAERLPPASGEEVKLRQFGASPSADGTQDSAQPKRPGASKSSSVSPSGTSAGGADPLKRGSSTTGSAAATQASAKTSPGSDDKRTGQTKSGGQSAATASGASAGKPGDGSAAKTESKSDRQAENKPADKAGTKAADKPGDKPSEESAGSKAKSSAASSQSAGKSGDKSSDKSRASD